MLKVNHHIQRKICSDGFLFVFLRNSESSKVVLERLMFYFTAFCPEYVDVEMNQGEESIVLDSFG